MQTLRERLEGRLASAERVLTEIAGNSFDPWATRVAEAELAAMWASRVDSETLAAALSIPKETALRRAAKVEWDRREAGDG